MAVYEEYDKVRGPKSGGPYLDELELLRAEKERAGKEGRPPRYSDYGFIPSVDPNPKTEVEKPKAKKAKVTEVDFKYGE